MSIKAVIFDLDGVITDTASYHSQAWRALAASLDISFDEKDNEALKGIDRMASLDYILNKADIEKTQLEKETLADFKNKKYQTLVASMTTKDMLPGARDLLKQLRKQGILLGLASSSKNASYVLERLAITDCFDYIANAERIRNNKPHPEIFLTVAHALKIKPEQCIGIEDSRAGIQAIKSAGMLAVGIGSQVFLAEADVVYSCLTQFKLENVSKILYKSVTNY